VLDGPCRIVAGADVNKKQGSLSKTPIFYVGNDTPMKNLLIEAGANCLLNYLNGMA
jgi:hypothetical protein